MLEVQKNNPLHGVKLEALLTELVEHYGWQVLASQININCFKSNPSIKSSLKFLRRTDWAREKVESFYLYKFKGLPKPNDREYELPPRDRTIPLTQKPRQPAKIDVADKPAPDKTKSQKPKPDKAKSPSRNRGGNAPEDPWGNWRK